MDSRQIRETFLSYFEERGHRRVPSSSLIPAGDPTLIFANAGMNQFKDLFLGLETRDYTRATSSQKCVRAGGKHNDLDNVGFTPRHHTFFEMLGNFSFGDYFKRDAVAYAWELSTKFYKLDPDRIWISIFEQDDEAFALWNKNIGVAENKIVRMGEKDNFWAMGEVGPCGPCSELYYDLGSGAGCGRPDCSPACDCGRFLEFWNLVFMQFLKDEKGEMRPLPKPSIDTGAGLERLAAILQKVPSNYETDLFLPILKRIEETSGLHYGTSDGVTTAMRVIADHSRAAAFLIADGALPGNEGRGYVLRRIIRRSLRFAHHLNLAPPIIARVVPVIAAEFGDMYPEVSRDLDAVRRVCTDEEERFERTLEAGVGHIHEVLDAAEKAGMKAVAGENLFLLYDTYGVPVDLVEELAREKKLKVDLDGFHHFLGEQRRRSKVFQRFDVGHEAVHERLSRVMKAEFSGYDALERKGRVLSLLREGREAEALHAGEEGEFMADSTPFYPEGGGQVGDRGYARWEGGEAEVLDTHRPTPALILHNTKILKGTLAKGTIVTLEVDRERREAAQRHHTATHLLHRALREVLGESARQMGSLVDPLHLRFDFSYGKALADDELKRIEESANRQVLLNKPVGKEILPIEEAKKRGALAFFGEKYGEKVRVVSVPGYSAEFCGGTHVERTGDIGLIKILSEKAIAAGVRRIEAVAGLASLKKFQEDSTDLWNIETALEAAGDDTLDKIMALREENKAKEKQIRELKLAQAKGSVSGISKLDIGGVPVLSQRLEGYAPQELRSLADEHLKNIASGIVFLTSEKEGKLSIILVVTKDLQKHYAAGMLAKEIGARLGGSGGGNPGMAQAGGTDSAALEKVLAELPEIFAKVKA
jgi:alanyl-tRNA synthetase